MTEWLLLFAAKCQGRAFFGFPKWFDKLECDRDNVPQLDGLGDIWIIVANITRMALFLVGVLAVVFIIIGGIQYITSTGDPDRVAKAKKLLTNAVIGLIIAIFASTLVGYIAGFFAG